MERRGEGTLVFAAPDYDLGAPQRNAEARALMQTPSRAQSKTYGGGVSRDSRGLKWDRLEGTEHEAEDISSELSRSSFAPIRVFTGKQALEDVFKSIHSPRILHVATHGFFLPNQQLAAEDRLEPATAGTEFGAARGLARLRAVENPLLRSGIVLAGANTIGSPDSSENKTDDGWVTAEEIAMMDLKGTELVVLSACETGLGDVRTGEGVFGLRRAFLYAGARTLVTSLFRVPDQQTREIMRNFYRSLAQGKSKLAALHNAQLEMIRKRRAETGAAHPFFWASFILVGSPD
jgi:CHAT domain-containing protein